ncbi:MAG: ABC transporter substrate binding protein, partial [Pseudomonadota bacterium]
MTDPAGAGVGISREDPLQHPPYMAGYGTMQPVAEALQTARGVFPDLKVVGTVWNPAESNSEANIKLARRVSREMGIELLEAPVDNSAGVWDATNSLVARGVQALWLGGDVTVMTALDSMISAANRGKIPVFTNIPGSADRGALFDVGANYTEVGRLAGELAANVLQGEDPATIPVVNLVPKRILINKNALVGLKAPWRFPDQLLAVAEVVGEKKSGREQTSAETQGSTSGAGSSPPVTGKIAGKRAKTWNVQLLEYINVVDVEEAEQGIRAGLDEAGLIEGRDYRLRIQNAQGDMATLNMMVDAAVTDGADLIMTLSTPTLQAALVRADDIPIVFTFVADAVAAGAGRSNEDHLPNVTGVPSTSPYKALIDIAREVLPGVRRVGTLYVPAEANSVV